MRASTNETGYKTFKNGGSSAISAGARVKTTAADTVDVAGATDAAIGVAYEVIPAGGYGTVKLFSAPGTFLCIASAGISVGAQVYPAASGKVAPTGTTALNLVALEAASADGDLINVAFIQKGA